MSEIKDMVAAEELLAEDSGNLMGGSGSKTEANRVGLSVVEKDGGCSAVVPATEVDKSKVCSLKNGVGNLSSEGYRGTRSVSDSVVDGRVVDGSSNVLLQRDEKISDDFFCTDNVGSDGRRGKKRGTINLNADVNVDGMGVGRWNGERLEDQDHGFRVGDFVWGKVKSHPWWPGQVYDPRDASEFALKHSQEGRVLVAFFGDGSCSWCLPSQLIPFAENLEGMWSDRSSKSLVNAVQKVVDEIGRLVESKITCKCIPSEKRGHLARPVVANAGVKAGVLVPEVDIDRLPIPEYEPAEMLAKVVGFAKTVSCDSVLELAILRSWMSAYSYAKCGALLPVYSNPLFIEGLQGNDNEEIAAYDSIVPTTTPSEGPLDDTTYRRRKQKTVAELMTNKKVFKSKTRKRSVGKAENGGSQAGLSSGKRGRKTRDEVSESTETTDDEVEAHMEREIGSSSRERRKSKYLSPPYTNLRGKIGYLGYKLEAELDELMEVDTEGKTMNGASQDQELSAVAVLPELDDKASKNEENMTFLASDVDVEVHDLLLKLESAAVDHFYLRKEGHLDLVWAFVSAHRSSTYVHGSDYKSHHKYKKVSHKRRKSSLASLSRSRPRGISPKISLPRKRPADKPADDIVSDARVIRQKLDTMTKILENYSPRFSLDEKSWLKDEMKHLMENVGKASDKVRLMAENTSS